ncbi:MAG: carbon starvation protein A [Candidatus Contendobacter odensis]|uniref:Carbon starvation protein A n=1 Tax=Candidatus Contendibacter odensensis TaxID=1400860 RepID=A0A2G6PG55_9GAMM|nr:MAG: carbon starvation protein A [Candidatus Contendobacter odensis]
MNAVWLALIGLIAFALGYLLYSRFIARKIYQLDPDYVTPSHSMEDGVDYVPTNKYVLWGHHFTSVAGAAPIIGPAVAVIWGWAPAFLWVVLGTIFFAGIHDFGAIWSSVRNKARSIGSFSGDLLGKRAQSLFMIIIFLLLLMVNAVFAVAIAKSFIKTPSSVLPSWSAILVALVIGQLIYRYKVGLLWPSLGGVIALYFFLYIGPLFPISLPDQVLGLVPNAQWIIIMFIYAAIASLLPVWVLLQPRDYINGLQLFIGLGILYISLFIFSPQVVAPAFNPNIPPGTPPIFPLLFVTIACGAISGFHSLVGSGTTAKQIDKETDERLVGYGGSVGEGLLALAAIVAVSAGFATLGDWQAVYTKFGAGGISAFVEGGANIVSKGLGLSHEFAATLLAVMAILFAGTTMDTGVRLQRYIVQEWGQIYNIPFLRSNGVATLVAVGACIALAFGAGGTSGAGGMIIWPLFGTTNQLLAGLALLVVSLLLLKLGRPVWFTLIPMAFLLVMTILALLLQLWSFFTAGNWLLIVMDILILIAAAMVALEAISALMRERQRLATAEQAN